MAGVRRLLQRVRRLEQAGDGQFAWVDQFLVDAQAGINAGIYDRTDMPQVMAAVQKWRTDKVWQLWA